MSNGFLARAVFTTHHKTVGLQFLALALFSVFFGMTLSLLMRMHLTGSTDTTPERYAALTLLHGSLMVFFVLTAAPQFGFGYYFLPLQIGAQEMAFPAFSAVAFWMALAAFAGMTASFFTGDAGPTIWLGSATLFCVAALLSAINFCVTAIDLRGPGVALTRLPLTVWSWFVTAVLSLLIFSVLLAACLFMLCDRFAGTQFFSTGATAEMTQLARGTLLGVWQRWFWFFAQAEVYIAVLPCFGLVSHLLSIFSRRPVWKERMAVLALCGVGVCGFCVWGYHMFSSGLNPYSPLVFSVLASSLGIPAAFLVASWVGTVWGAKPRFTVAMLFALGFVALFLSGGVTGVLLSNARLAASAAPNDLVTGHFHLVMGVAATFAIIAGLFFWLPKMSGRRLNERAGKIHFWLTIAGVYCIFIPMPWVNALDRSHSPFISQFVAVAVLVTIAAQFLFLGNFFRSLLRGDAVRKNPWRATTLEWFVSSPPPRENFSGAAPPSIYRGAYEIGRPFAGGDFIPQHLAPELVEKYR